MASVPEDFIDTFYHSIGDLHAVRKSLDMDYAAELVEILKRVTKDISDLDFLTHLAPHHRG